MKDSLGQLSACSVHSSDYACKQTHTYSKYNVVFISLWNPVCKLLDNVFQLANQSVVGRGQL